MYCASCGVEHDLSELEPSFERPDAYFAIPGDERAARCWNGDTMCVLRTPEAPDRFYLRVVLPIPVRGEPQPFCWGVWVEVAEPDFTMVYDRWDDPDQSSATPFPARLANGLHDMPPTVGLPGSVRLTSPTTVPSFELAPELDHPLAVDQREGVYSERLLEWLSPVLHHG
jgi:hypothetical protein